MRRETLNIILLGLGFGFIFTSYNSQACIAEPVLSSYREHDPSMPANFGYHLQSFLYCVFIFGNFLAPPVVKLLGSKWALVFSSIAYILILLGFEILNVYYFLGIGLLVGVAGGVLWGSMGDYVALNSNDETLEKNSGLVWLIYMFSNVLGGVFLLIMFNINANNSSYTVKLIREIFAVLSVVSFLGTITFLFLEPKYPKEDELEITDEEGRVQPNKSVFKNVIREIGSTVRLLFTKKYLFLIPISAFTGLELGLYSVTYVSALQFTQKFPMNNQILVAWSLIAIGAGEILAGVPLTFYGKGSLSYSFFMTIGCVMAVAAYALVYINVPSNAVFGTTGEVALIQPNVILALLAAFLMGAVDAILNIMVLAYICRLYPDEQTTAAYALRNMLQALACAFVIFLSSSIALHWQLLFLVIFAIFSAITFYISEIRWKRSDAYAMPNNTMTVRERVEPQAVNAGTPLLTAPPFVYIISLFLLGWKMKRETWNIIQMGLGFCFVFSAVNSQAFIVEPVISSYHNYDPSMPANFGYTLMAITFTSLMIGNFLAPPFIKVAGSKWCIAFSSLYFPISLIGFEIMNIYYFISTAIIGGIISGAMWGAMGEYIALNSKDGEVEKNTGLAWLIYMSSYILGGIFLLIIFTVNPQNSYTLKLIREIFGILTIVSVVGCSIFFLLQSKYIEEPEKKPRADTTASVISSVWEETVSTGKHLFSKDFFFLIPISIFSGLELGVFAVTYPTALQFTDNFSMNNQVLVAWVSVAIGMGEIAAGGPLFFLGKGRFSFKFYIILSCLAELIAYTLIIISVPTNAVFGHTKEESLLHPSAALALVAAFFMGVADSIINIMTLGYICQYYESQQQATIAYSLRNTLQALSIAGILFLSSYVSLYWQLGFISIFSLVSAISFSISEIQWSRSLSSKIEKHNPVIPPVQSVI